MIINHNIAALNTYNHLSTAGSAAQKNMSKLSSGLRINSSADDAAGMAISEKMRAQIRGLDQSVRNAQDGISLLQTAEGALSGTESILTRMRELAVQSSNDTNTLDDRKEIQKEINQLVDEIDRISTATEFNGKKLLDGSLDGSKSTTTDSTSGFNNTMKISSINLSGSVSVTAATNSVTLVYDGEEIELNGLTNKTYTGAADGQKIEDFAKDLQRLIDANETLAGHVKVSGTQVNGTEATLTFDSDKDLGLQSALSNPVAAGFGLASGTTSFEEKYEVVAGAAFDTTGGFDVNATGITITYNDTAVDLTLEDLAYDGTTTNLGLDALVEDIQEKINANTTLKGHVSVYNDDGKIRFTSDKEIKVEDNGTTAFAATGLADGQESVAINPETADSTGASTGQSIHLQVGANEGQTMSINISKMDTQSLGDTRAVATASGETNEAHYDYSVKGAGVTANVVVDGANNSFVIKYDGTDYNVSDLTTRTYTYTSDTDMEALAKDIQSKIDDIDGLKDHVSVSVNTGHLVFTGDKDFEIGSSDTNGIDLSTEFGITAGTSATEQAFKMEGSAVTGFNVDLSGAATGDDIINLKYNDTAVALTLSDTDFTGNFEGFVSEIQSQINANDTLKGHVTATLEDNKLVFNSDKELSLTTITGTDLLAVESVIGYLEGQEATVQNKTTDYVTGEGLLISSLKVEDVDSGTGGVLTASSAEKAITAIDDAIKQVSAERSRLGAYQNRLDYSIDNLDTMSENLTTAESSIRDVDMAKEMMEFTKNNILNQAAQAMLAQANQQPQQVLQLLR